MHVRINGKSLQEAHDDFMAHLFRYLDVKGNGYLGKEEAERAPLISHIISGGPGSVFGGGNIYGMGSGAAEVSTLADLAAKKNGKVTQADLAGYYRTEGLMPFQLQEEAGANNNVAMMVLGGGGSSEPTVEQVSNAIFGLLDTKKTGQLTKAELLAAPDILGRLDANEDEMITVRELVPAAPPILPPKNAAVMTKSPTVSAAKQPKLSRSSTAKVFLVAAHWRSVHGPGRAHPGALLGRWQESRRQAQPCGPGSRRGDLQIARRQRGRLPRRQGTDRVCQAHA